MMKICLLLAVYCLSSEALPADVSSGSVETQVENPNKKAFFNSATKPYKRTDISPVDIKGDNSEESSPPKTLIVISKDQFTGPGITKISRIQLRKKSDSNGNSLDAPGSATQNENTEALPERSSESGSPVNGGVMVQRGVLTPVITANDEDFIVISRQTEDGSEVAISNVPEEEVIDQTKTDIKDTPETFIRDNPMIVDVKQKKPMVPKSEANPIDEPDLLQSASASKIYLLPPPSDMEKLGTKRSDESKVYSVSRAQTMDGNTQMINLNSQDDGLKETKTFSKLCGAIKDSRKTSKITENEYQEDDPVTQISENNNKDEPVRRFDQGVPSDNLNGPVIIPQPAIVTDEDSMRQNGESDLNESSKEPDTSAEPEVDSEIRRNAEESPTNIQEIIYGKPQGTDVNVQALSREDKEKKMKKKLAELGEEFQIPDELTAIKKDEEVLVPRNPQVSIKESGMENSPDFTRAGVRK